MGSRRRGPRRDATHGGSRLPTPTTATPTAAAGAKGRGLRAHIVALVAATLLPAFAISGWAVHEAVSSYKGAFEERLRDTSRALATALDREFEAHVGALTALAASPRLDGLGADSEFDGLAAFHGHARRAAAALGTPVVLIGTR